MTLSSVSATFYMSPFYLSHIFKQATGFNFIEYLNTVRIKESKRLLKESELSVTQIAEKVGFESSNHFGRVFKVLTGIPPIRYRKSIP